MERMTRSQIESKILFWILNEERRKHDLNSGARLAERAISMVYEPGLLLIKPDPIRQGILS